MVCVYEYDPLHVATAISFVILAAFISVHGYA
jgi:hypothetical protein